MITHGSSLESSIYSFGCIVFKDRSFFKGFPIVSYNMSYSAIITPEHVDYSELWLEKITFKNQLPPFQNNLWQHNPDLLIFICLFPDYYKIDFRRCNTIAFGF